MPNKVARYTIFYGLGHNPFVNTKQCWKTFSMNLIPSCGLLAINDWGCSSTQCSSRRFSRMPQAKQYSYGIKLRTGKLVKANSRMHFKSTALLTWICWNWPFGSAEHLVWVFAKEDARMKRRAKQSYQSPTRNASLAHTVLILHIYLAAPNRLHCI